MDARYRMTESSVSVSRCHSYSCETKLRRKKQYKLEHKGNVRKIQLKNNFVHLNEKQIENGHRNRNLLFSFEILISISMDVDFFDSVVPFDEECIL